MTFIYWFMIECGGLFFGFRFVLIFIVLLLLINSAQNKNYRNNWFSKSKPNVQHFGKSFNYFSAGCLWGDLRFKKQSIPDALEILNANRRHFCALIKVFNQLENIVSNWQQIHFQIWIFFSKNEWIHQICNKIDGKILFSNQKNSTIKTQKIHENTTFNNNHLLKGNYQIFSCCYISFASNFNFNRCKQFEL